MALKDYKGVARFLIFPYLCKCTNTGTKIVLVALQSLILLNNNFFLLTEREGRTGEYWPEVGAVRTERSEASTKTTEGQYSPVRLELARLVSILLYGFLITFCFVFVSP